MAKHVDITGKKFNYLTAIEFARYDKRKSQFWLFQCDCGNKKVINKAHVISGHTKSCGCKVSELCRNANLTHGATANRKISKEFSTWCGMKQRCFDKNSNHYYRYGGRGITVCDRWLDFSNFLSDIGEIPKGYSLERKDNDGNYEPSNCTLIPLNKQKRNTSKNKIVTYKNETDCLINLCEKYNKDYNLVYQRIWKGWGVARAFDTPRLRAC